MGLIAPFFIYLIFINKHFSMSVILLNNNNFKKLLKEAPISGDKAAQDIAKAEGGIAKAKDRLARLQITDIPGLDSINTIDQLAIEPFKFDFLLQIPDNPQGLTLPVPHPFETLARVVEKNPLTLEVKTNEGVLFKMIFTKEEELITQLPGTKEPIIGKSNKVMALVSEDGKEEGKYYSIQFDHAKELVDEANKEKEKGGVESEEDKKNKSGETKGEETEGEGTEGGKNNKEQLFNDLAGFFKFTYNNRRLAAPELFPKEKRKNTLESYINQIAKKVILIKEDDEDEGEGEEDNSKDPTKMTVEKDYIGQIYVQTIVLGPKAKARAGEEKNNYVNKVNQSQKGQTKWDGNFNNLPKAKVGQIPPTVNVGGLSLVLDDSNLSPEQERIFKQIQGLLGKSNFEGETTIRRSARDKGTIIIGFPTLGGKKAIVCKLLNKETNLMKNLSVEIAPKMTGNDKFTESTIAKIRIKKL
jgi:hypothetical protein